MDKPPHGKAEREQAVRQPCEPQSKPGLCGKRLGPLGEVAQRGSRKAQHAQPKEPGDAHVGATEALTTGGEQLGNEVDGIADDGKKDQGQDSGG